ncbi:hypothetical protein G6F60_015053 [Rhizopus arrhizus]|nr:hypothetical protein G6F60_015053 [Rhizopus arrhizus]
MPSVAFHIHAFMSRVSANSILRMRVPPAASAGGAAPSQPKRWRHARGSEAGATALAATLPAARACTAAASSMRSYTRMCWKSLPRRKL